MGKQKNESSGSSKPPAFPMVALHCKELFEQLRLRTKKPKKLLDDQYGALFDYAPATIRA